MFFYFNKLSFLKLNKLPITIKIITIINVVSIAFGEFIIIGLNFLFPIVKRYGLINPTIT